MARRIGLGAILTLALIGCGLMLNGATHGQRQHRIFALLVGAVFTVPGLSFLIFRERALQIMKLACFAGIPLVFVLGVLEVGTRILELETLLRPITRFSEVLDIEMIPGSGELDQLGFRNREVPDVADVVVLGDSMTYGFNVKLSEAYPQRLAELLPGRVYNMGIGSYGALQYLALLDRAFGLNPRAIVVSPYLGNDIEDAFITARLDTWSEYQDPEIDYPVLDRAANLYAPNLAVGMMVAVERHSKLVGVVSGGLRLLLATRQMLAGLHDAEPGNPHYESDSISTQFTPLRRIRSMDFSRPEIVDGERIMLTALDQIAARITSRGVVPVLFVIHTKEFYYCEMMKLRGEPRSSLLQAVEEAEMAVTARLIEAAVAAGYVLLDPTEAMVAALAEGIAVYPANSDGHPTAEGHRVLANALASSRSSWLD